MQLKKKTPRLKRLVCSRVVGVLGPVVPVFWSVALVGEHPSLSLCFLKAI